MPSSGSGQYRDGFVAGWRSSERSRGITSTLVLGLTFIVAYGTAAALAAR